MLACSKIRLLRGISEGECASGLARRSLYNNQLSGSLPSSLGSLTSLHSLYVVVGPSLSPTAPLFTLSPPRCFSSAGVLHRPVVAWGSERECASDFVRRVLPVKELSGTLPSSIGSMRLLTLLYVWVLPVCVDPGHHHRKSKFTSACKPGAGVLFTYASWILCV